MSLCYVSVPGIRTKWTCLFRLIFAFNFVLVFMLLIFVLNWTRAFFFFFLHWTFLFRTSDIRMRNWRSLKQKQPRPEFLVLQSLLNRHSFTALHLAWLRGLARGLYKRGNSLGVRQRVGAGRLSLASIGQALVGGRIFFPSAKKEGWCRSEMLAVLHTVFVGFRTSCWRPIVLLCRPTWLTSKAKKYFA